VQIRHPFGSELELIAGAGPGGALPGLLFCENETNTARLFGAAPATPYPKDGINDRVISGAATINPGRVRHQVCVLVSGHGRARRNHRAPAAPAASRGSGHLRPRRHGPGSHHRPRRHGALPSTAELLADLAATAPNR